jgi:hypothetical protein
MDSAIEKMGVGNADIERVLTRMMPDSVIAPCLK